MLGRGFTEDPDVPVALALLDVPGLAFPPMRTTYILGRNRLFSAMSNNTQAATAFFQIPPNRVVEMGAQVVIWVRGSGR